MRIIKILGTYVPFLFALLLVLGGAPAFAAVDATYNVFEAILEDDGTVTQTATPIPGPISVNMYSLDAATAAVISTIFTGASFPTNSITLTGATAYPTTLPVGATYWGVYVYRAGYIPLEIRSTYQGTGTVGPYTRYLGRVRNCRAPTVDLTVANSAQANIPLQIGVAASLNPSAYAPIQAGGSLTFTPAIADYNVNVDVTVQVRNSAGVLVATLGPTTLSIPYSQSATTSFSWTPAVVDTYTITATGAPNDAKCMSSISQTATKQTTVIAGAVTNMCYTLLQNLTYSPIYVTSGTPISVTVQKISNSADGVGTLTPIATSLTINVVGSVSGQIGGFPINTVAAANPTTTTYVTVPSPAWTFTPASAQTYTVTVTGVGSACTFATNNPETMTLSFYVYGPPAVPPPPPPPPGPGGGSGGSSGGGSGTVITLLAPTTTFGAVSIPKELDPNDRFIISGTVKDPPLNGFVEAQVDGEPRGDGAIDQAGNFRIVLATPPIGEHKVKLKVRATQAELTQNIVVHATVKIPNIDVEEFAIGRTNKVFVDIDVSYPSEVEVRLYIDGELIIAKKTAVTKTAKIDFDYTPDKEGEKEVRAVALIFGSTADKRTKAVVAEMGAPAAITGFFAALANFFSNPAVQLAVAAGIVAALAALIYLKYEAVKAAILAALAWLTTNLQFKKVGTAIKKRITKILEALGLKKSQE